METPKEELTRRVRQKKEFVKTRLAEIGEGTDKISWVERKALYQSVFESLCEAVEEYLNYEE